MLFFTEEGWQTHKGFTKNIFLNKYKENKENQHKCYMCNVMFNSGKYFKIFIDTIHNQGIAIQRNDSVNKSQHKKKVTEAQK